MFAKGQALFAGAGARAASAQPFVSIGASIRHHASRDVYFSQRACTFEPGIQLKLSTNAQHELCSFLQCARPPQ
jgi:hypothetical protein